MQEGTGATSNKSKNGLISDKTHGQFGLHYAPYKKRWES